MHTNLPIATVLRTFAYLAKVPENELHAGFFASRTAPSGRKLVVSWIPRTNDREADLQAVQDGLDQQTLRGIAGLSMMRYAAALRVRRAHDVGSGSLVVRCGRGGLWARV